MRTVQEIPRNDYAGRLQRIEDIMFTKADAIAMAEVTKNEMKAMEEKIDRKFVLSSFVSLVFPTINFKRSEDDRAERKMEKEEEKEERRREKEEEKEERRRKEENEERRRKEDKEERRREKEGGEGGKKKEGGEGGKKKEGGE